MQDLASKLEKLLSDAVDCDLIGNLATEKDKREVFRSLASQYRVMADAIRKTIADREAT